MKKCNEDVREYAKRNGLFLWQIADAFNISPETLNKRLRHELNREDKEEIFNIIKKLSDQKED